MVRETAGQIANKALKDNTKYKPLEIAHAQTDGLEHHIRECIENYRDKIDQNEFCVVMVIAEDPLIKTLKRRKFYCWPWLPSPRPNQSVFLYNKGKDRLTKRLWVLPNALTMAELATPGLIVGKDYETMQAWSIAFYKGTFWDYIRHEHHIKMLSQEEFFESNSSEIPQSLLNQKNPSLMESFDFSKIQGNNFADAK